MMCHRDETHLSSDVLVGCRAHQGETDQENILNGRTVRWEGADYYNYCSRLLKQMVNAWLKMGAKDSFDKNLSPWQLSIKETENVILNICQTLKLKNETYLFYMFTINSGSQQFVK